MSHWGKIFVVTAFAVWLATPLVLLVLGVESGFPALEQRPPETPPRLEVGNVTDPRFYARAGRYFGDRVPLRVEALALDAWLDLEVFGDSPHAGVLLGADGWLFGSGTVLGPCREPVPSQDAVIKLRELSHILHASGRRLIILVAPDKAAIYPEHLGSWADLGRCISKSRRRLRAQLERAELPDYVDLWQALRSLKARGELVYWPHDTHWTSLGALEATRQIVSRLDPALWDQAAVRKSHEGRRGDLSNVIGLPEWLKAPQYNVQRDVEVERSHVRGFRHFSGAGEVALFESRVLMVKDSFGDWYHGKVLQYLGDSIWLTWPKFAKAGPVAMVDEFARAKVVIFESVERSLVSRVDEFWPDLPILLVGRLLDDLPVTDLGLPSEEPTAEPPEIGFTLPKAAQNADRYLVIDVASSREDARAGGLQINIRHKEGLPWVVVEPIEGTSTGDSRRMVAKLPWPKLTVMVHAAPGVVRSVGLIELGGEDRVLAKAAVAGPEG